MPAGRAPHGEVLGWIGDRLGLVPIGQPMSLPPEGTVTPGTLTVPGWVCPTQGSLGTVQGYGETGSGWGHPGEGGGVGQSSLELGVGEDGLGVSKSRQKARARGLPRPGLGAVVQVQEA